MNEPQRVEKGVQTEQQNTQQDVERVQARMQLLEVSYSDSDFYGSIRASFPYYLRCQTYGTQVF